MGRQVLGLDVVLELIGQIEFARYMQQGQIRLEGAGQLDCHLRGFHGVGGAVDRHKDALEHGRNLRAGTGFKGVSLRQTDP